MSSPAHDKSCLHLVATARESALKDCLNQRLESDSVVFIDAGVMHLVAELPGAPSLAGAGFFFSSEDLQARGLIPFARQQSVKTLDDRATVRLLRQHDHCLTWK